MRPLAWIGIVVLIVGVLAFIVPVPISHSHSVKLGDASVGVTTHTDEKLSPIDWGRALRRRSRAVGSRITQIYGLKKAGTCRMSPPNLSSKC